MAVAVSSPAFVSGDDFPADYGEWFPKDRRRAGVLLYPSSFPGPYSIGEEAFRFIDWLLDSGRSLWLFGRSILRLDYKPKDLLELIKPDHSPKPATVVAEELEAFIIEKKVIGMVISIFDPPQQVKEKIVKERLGYHDGRPHKELPKRLSEGYRRHPDLCSRRAQNDQMRPKSQERCRENRLHCSEQTRI